MRLPIPRGNYQFGHLPANSLGCRPAKGGLGLPIPSRDLTLTVDGDKGVVGGVEDTSVQLFYLASVRGFDRRLLLAERCLSARSLRHGRCKRQRRERQDSRG